VSEQRRGLRPVVRDRVKGTHKRKSDWLGAILVIGLSHSCASFRSPAPEALPDGNYRISCKKPLATCLSSLDSVCKDGYQIVRATEDRKRKGAYPAVYEFVESEAVISCRQAESLAGPGARGHAAAGGASPSSPTAKPPPPSGEPTRFPTCVPWAPQDGGVGSACTGG
jgi:hypothetical protein